MINGLGAINSTGVAPLNYKGKISKPNLDLKKSKANNDAKKEEKKKLTKTQVATYSAAATAIIGAGIALYKTGKLKGATNALKDSIDAVIGGFKKLKHNFSADSLSSLEKRGGSVADGATSAVERRSEAVQGAINGGEKKQNDIINNSKPNTKPTNNTTEKIQTQTTAAAQKTTGAAAKNSSNISNKLLFPNGIENIEFMQSNIGDCYLLSSVYGLSRNSKGQELLKNMVSIKDDGNFVVKFHNQKPITISPAQLKGTVLKQGEKPIRTVYGDLGLQAIECAYGKQKMALALNNTPQSAYLKAIKDGSPDEALKLLGGFNTRLYGDSLNGVLSNQKVDVERILNDAADNIDNRIICATTPKAKFAAVKEGKNAWMDKQKVFDCSHAYNITNIDKKHKKVTLINPHDTTKKEVLSFNEFSKIFSRIYETII